MKKVISLLLAILLCVSLTACRNTMSAEEAIKIYPNIIGTWASGYLNEESVLIINEDGSCVLMNENGTWHLDTGASSDESLTLKIQTESKGKYSAFFANYWKGDFFEGSNLTITNTKRKAVIYDAFAYNQNRAVISAQDVLKAVPQLEGQWGSEFFAEEPVLELNKDGTCKYLGREGIWAGEISTLSRAEHRDTIYYIHTKSANGEELSLQFVFFDSDLGYTQTSLNTHMLSGVDTHYPILVDRTELTAPMEGDPAIIGEWVSKEDNSFIAFFSEEGTCNIMGADGLWTLDYPSFYDEKYLNGWDRIYKAKIDDSVWDIYIKRHSDGTCKLTVMNPDNGMHLVQSLLISKANEK